MSASAGAQSAGVGSSAAFFGTLERGDADVRLVQLSPATFLFGQPHYNEAHDEEAILRVISAPASSAVSVASFNHASAL